MFFDEAELIDHLLPGVCRKDDHNQTLEAYVESKKKPKFSELNRDSSSSSGDGSILGKRKSSTIPLESL
jgi:hypothetical protein